MASSAAPVWPGPSLLVPIACDVLLVGTPDSTSAGVWAATQTSYQNLYMGNDAGPLPFSRITQPRAVGAHLMWTLPNALRHGVQDADTGVVSFRSAPNRWLVLRIGYPSDGSAPTFSAAVLNSDALGTLDPNQPQFPDPGGGAPTSIGQYQTLDVWSAPLGPKPAFLQAVGPGNVGWAASYDNIRNVFALHDALPQASGQYAYLVAGWYADPSSDIAAQFPTDEASWEAALDGLSWSIGESGGDLAAATAAWQAFSAAWGIGSGAPSSDLPPAVQKAATAWLQWQKTSGAATASGDLPRQTIYHSLVATLDWKGSAHAYGTGAPGGGTSYPSVAIGNTGAEAISAYMAKRVVDAYGQPDEDRSVIERALEAFQLGFIHRLAPDVVGTEALLHQSRFGSIEGGSEWIVVQPPPAAQPGGSTTPNAGRADDAQVIALTPEQTEALSSLNEAQSRLDECIANLETQRGELAAVIYKANQLGRSSPAWLTPLIQNALTAISAAVTASTAERATLHAAVASRRQSLAAALGSEYELKPVSRRPYYQPNDPVLLVGGAQLDTKLAAPGTYEGDPRLRVRITGQTVTGLTLTFSIGGQPATHALAAADLFATGQAVLPAGAGGPLAGLPKEVAALMTEAILLDPSAAKFLAGRWFASAGHSPSAAESTALSGQIADMQRSLWSSPGGLDETLTQMATGVLGTVPAAAGVSFRSGQPWTPIFLDWQVRWVPNAPSSAALDAQLADWSLDEIDYSWQGTLDPSLGISIIGRSIVGAEGALALKAQFATFENDPDYADLPDYIREDLQRVADTIGSLDMLTQSLTGFNAQLTTRLNGMMQLIATEGGATKVPVTAAEIALVGEGPWTFQPSTGDAPTTPGGGGTSTGQPFFPVRAGHLQIERLWVVDAFGQVLVGQDPRREPAPIQVITAQSMATAGNPDVAELPPRLVQPSRADLRLISAASDAILSNASLATNPICGWIMSNHLDDSLMVFDASGNNQGSILTIERDTGGGDPGRGLRWDAVPGSSAPLGSAPALENVHLQGFVSALIQRGMSGDDSFGDLLDIIDAALWRIGAGGGGTDNLSALIGRPLALVRARVEFELRGEPRYEQSWANTGQYYVSQAGASVTYAPKPVPLQAAKLAYRIGDLGYQDNGVVGYFVGSSYGTIYSAHEYTPTSAFRRSLRASSGAVRSRTVELDETHAPSSGYVEANHLIELAPNASPIYVTILLDPTHVIPFVSGSLPAARVSLPQGPAAAALQQMLVSFRVGPILTDPAEIRMPLPAEIRGKWGWAARADVARWTALEEIASEDASVHLPNVPPTLSEGWLTLSGAIASKS